MQYSTVRVLAFFVPSLSHSSIYELAIMYNISPFLAKACIFYTPPAFHISDIFRLVHQCKLYRSRRVQRTGPFNY